MTVTLVLVACGGSERLTLEQYAQFCAGGVASAAELIEPDQVTWADLVEIGEPSLERLRSVEPPQELADFHRASIKTLDFVVGVASEQPAEEVANPLVFGLDAIRIGTQLRRAVEEIPADVRGRLSDAGCL